MLTWKIVGASNASVLYIYIDYVEIFVVFGFFFKKEKEKEKGFMR